MILSRKFVSDYIDLDEKLDIKQIAEDMTSVGNEYDSCGMLVDCTNLVIGEVLECFDIEGTHLHECLVDVKDEKLNIVCGAPNVRKGIKVIVAKNGAHLPGGEIKKSMIKGHESNGMLCALFELGIDKKYLKDKDIEGIAELDSDAKVGDDPIKYLELDDEVVDFELTSNRGDELSVLGLAYELGAIYGKKVKDIDLSHNEIKESIRDSFKIDIKTDKCSLFLARKVKNVVIKESPKFIKNRLIACGIRPINNVVDISNYVMLETGQPLHFYDANRLGDTLIVRDAKENEELVTLDNIKRNLSTSDIVISNKNEAVGLAGVMGGLSTEVEEDTKDIIVESAIFDSVSVRLTSKKVLRSEASNRFEKGLDPNRTYMAMERAVKLLEEYAEGEVLKDTITYDKTEKEDKHIVVESKEINEILGSNISDKDIIDVFERLGFNVKNTNGKMDVTIPTRRLDVNIKEDLVEEVGRIYGINNIESTLPNLGIRQGKCDMTTRNIRSKLVDLGLNEVLTQVFINPEKDKCFSEKDLIKLSDPLSVDKSAIRSSMIQSLLKVYKYNTAQNFKDISIFEMGKCFFKEDGNYIERYRLGLLMTGEYYIELGNNKKVDFYIVKGIVEQLLDYLGYKGRYNFSIDNLPKEIHPGVGASININGTNIGYMGRVHPSMLKEDVYVMELDLDTINEIRTGKIKYKDFARFPSIKKDVAFIVNKDITSEQIEKEINKAGGKLLTDVKVFDVYTGEKIEDSEKQIAYSLTFTDPDKTLTEEEVMQVFNKIIESVKEKLSARLRDN